MDDGTIGFTVVNAPVITFWLFLTLSLSPGTEATFLHAYMFA